MISTSKRLSGVFFTAGLAIILSFDNSFPNALCLSFENNVKSYYSSSVILIDNTVSSKSKVVMINFHDGRMVITLQSLVIRP